jgi:protein-disulfide isomerase
VKTMPVQSMIKGALDVLSSVAVITVAGVVVWTFGFKEPATPSPPHQVTPITGLRIEAPAIRNTAGTGQLAIIEFADFQCPFCRNFAKDSLPTLKDRLVESGRARYIAFHFPLEKIHPFAAKAGQAAECAGNQGKFWAMHANLFKDPNALAADDLVQRAKVLRLDMTRFEQCLNADQTLDAVRADQAEGRRLGVMSTPTFFIGRVRNDGGIDLTMQIRGAASADVFMSEIEKAGERLVSDQRVGS